jgi:glycosyltransferase involved in cell wall biosynthesis
MAKRRVLSIAHSYVVAMNRRLVHEMALNGADRWDVTAVAPTYFHGSGDLRPVTFESQGGEPCEVVPMRAYLTRMPHVFFYGWALRSLMAESWDLIHCWEEPFLLVGGQMALWTPRDTPLVFRSAQSIDKRYPFPFSAIERYAIRRASGWICSGRLVAETLGARSGYDRLPHAQIPLGVDVNAFRPDREAGDSVLRKLGWRRDGPPVIGYLGRLAKEKGLAVLQEALDQVNVPWRALFVGDGPERATLEAWATSRSDRVRICSDVTHSAVPPYLNAMDVLCAPSQTMPNWKEQFGRMVVEAFAVGVPVIGSDSGEIPFVVGETGFIVGERDAAGWKAAITDLIGDEPRRRELSVRGIERARSEFAWPVVARRYLDFFEQILDRQGSSGTSS